jgi:hypothetical protein
MTSCAGIRRDPSPIAQSVVERLEGPRTRRTAERIRDGLIVIEQREAARSVGVLKYVICVSQRKIPRYPHVKILACVCQREEKDAAVLFRDLFCEGAGHNRFIY